MSKNTTIYAIKNDRKVRLNMVKNQTKIIKQAISECEDMGDDLGNEESPSECIDQLVEIAQKIERKKKI